jgi:NADPH-dependent glutamate synthase beta subunit-like oxidoreductase
MEMPKLSIEKRLKSFDEVELGFTEEQAIEEANRCLQCKNPMCVQGCPARVNIPKFIKEFREGNIEQAAKTIRERNFFPSICGRICQHEKQCEGHCILEKTGNPINIGGLERFIGDNAPLPVTEDKIEGKKAAIIGSGPSGLTVAAILAKKGIDVTVFEGSNSFGGVIKYGVPNFRLPKETVTRELKNLHSLGVDLEPNAKIADESLEMVAKEFDVVFVGTGVGRARDLNVEGSKLKGISSAMKFLVNLNQSEVPIIKEGEKLVVIGGGYVGIDAARAAVRLGAKVTVVTFAKKEDATKTVSEKDFKEAEEEGVKFMFGLEVKKFEGDDKVQKVYYSNGKDGFLEADKVIYAIGQKLDDDEMKQPLRDDKTGCVIVNENHKTKLNNVFAAGDCVHGPKTVIHAIDAGREAAKAMLKHMGVEE